MSDFDRDFADRLREVFDDYHEPVDPAALARMRAALGHPTAPPPVAPDRPPVAAAPPRWRRGLFVAVGAATLAAVAVAGVLWLQALPSAPSPEPVATAVPPPPDAPRSPSEEAESTAAEPLLTPSAPRTSGAPPASAPGPSPLGRGEDAPSPSLTPAPEPTAPPTPAPLVATDDPPAPDRPEPAAPTSAPLPDVAGLPDALEARRPALPALAPPSAPAPSPQDRPSVDRASPYRLVLGTSTPLAGPESVEGAGVAGGVSREWPVAGRVSVSGGALIAYNRYDIDASSSLSTTGFQDLQLDPSRTLDVAAQTRAETVALEVPLDVAFAVAQTRRGGLGVSVGVTSAVYLAQSFQDEGTRYSGAFVPDGVTLDGVFVVTGEPYRASEGGGALGRVEVARQLNLGARLWGARGPSASSVDVYARLPLGGLTDRDLGLTTVGARLRLPLR